MNVYCYIINKIVNFAIFFPVKSLFYCIIFGLIYFHVVKKSKDKKIITNITCENT